MPGKDTKGPKKIKDTKAAKVDISEAENVFSESHQTEVDKDAFLSSLEEYRDKMLQESLERASTVTCILSNYNQQQSDRYKYKKGKKKIIFWILLGIIVLFSIAIIAWVSVYFKFRQDFDIDSLIALIAACVTYIGSLISVLLIIVKYIFPEDEEKNFNDLVTAIIKDDTVRIKNQFEYISQAGKRNKK